MSTFTTSQKIEPKLNNRELGELRLKKLKEAQDNGAIGLAKDRGSLAELVGIPKDKPTAATWVGRLVRNGTVSETLIGFSPDTHKPEYEYHYSPNKTANKPKNIPTAREKMLLWIQNNIIDCKDTTYKQLAERSLIPGLTTSQRRSCLYALVRQDYIRVKEGEHGNKTKKSFYINYLNDKLPPSLREYSKHYKRRTYGRAYPQANP